MTKIGVYKVIGNHQNNIDNKNQVIQNDLSTIKTKASSDIEKISKNNDEFNTLICQYKSRIKDYKSKNIDNTDIEKAEDSLYDALDNLLNFCIKYEKVIF